jgi:hypothetical protein
MHKLGVLVALAIVGTLFGIAPAGAQPTPEVTSFCEAALTADKAVEKVLTGPIPPKQKDVQAAEAALSQAESTAPPEVASTMQAVVAGVRTGFEAQQNPFDADPSFEQTFNTLQQYRYNSCGYRQLDVTGVEYAFEGLPKTLPPGPVAIRFTDTGAEWHELRISRIKSKDSAKEIASLPEKEARKKVEQTGATFARQGQTSYTIADLSKPGRYVVVCFLPVGSTSDPALEEAEKEHAKEHWQEGMIATIRVERGATTTSAAS